MSDDEKPTVTVFGKPQPVFRNPVDGEWSVMLPWGLVHAHLMPVMTISREPIVYNLEPR